jgi:hypothetical protein
MKPKEITGFIVLLLFLALFIHIIILFVIWYLFEKAILGNDKFVITGKKKYVFIEKSEVAFSTFRINEVNYSSHDGMLVISSAVNAPATIIVCGNNPKFKGYAWDGCSPKFQVFDLIFGTPDGAVISGTGRPAAYYASMVHDVLYQYHKKFKDKITRKQVDLIFLDELRKQNFRLAYIYFLFVRGLGGVYWGAKRKHIK